MLKTEPKSTMCKANSLSALLSALALSLLFEIIVVIMVVISFYSSPLLTDSYPLVSSGPRATAQKNFADQLIASVHWDPSCHSMSCLFLHFLQGVFLLSTTHILPTKDHLQLGNLILMKLPKYMELVPTLLARSARLWEG